MPSITIIGPGAIGGTAAAWLTQDKSNKINVCARTSFAQLTVETPYGILTATPEIFTSPEEASITDWVLIATKTYDTEKMAGWLPKVVDKHTRVAILQNGVEHIERFEPYIPIEQLVPVIVDLPAERKAPGHIWQRRDGNLIVHDNNNGREFTTLFCDTRLTATTTKDFLSQAWRKLALNCAGALPALLLKPIKINEDEELIDVLRALIRECILVGRADGAILEDALEDEIISRYRSGPSNAINSLHADRLAGRQTEIESRNGAVVRIGRKHGIATPVNKLVTTLIKTATEK